MLFADRVEETTTSTGTGSLTLAGAKTGMRSFDSVFGHTSSVPNFYYCVEAVDTVGNPTGDWEVGTGHLSASTTFVRDTVLASSNSGSAVSFGAGTKNVFSSAAADYMGNPPTTVQSTSGNAAASNSTSVAATFGSTTTVGNTVVLFVAGYGSTGTNGAYSPPAGFIRILDDSGVSAGNQHIAIFVSVVTAGATTYTVDVTNPNGGQSIYAMELSGVHRVEAFSGAGILSSATISFPVLSRRFGLHFAIVEIDTESGTVSSVSSGLTQLAYKTTPGSNHPAFYAQIADSAIGTAQSVTLSATPSGGQMFAIVCVT